MKEPSLLAFHARLQLHHLFLEPWKIYPGLFKVLAHISLEPIQDARNPGFCLRNTDDGAEKHSRDNPEVECGESDAVDFEADEDCLIEGVGVYGSNCSRKSYCDGANEK